MRFSPSMNSITTQGSGSSKNSMKEMTFGWEPIFISALISVRQSSRPFLSLYTLTATTRPSLSSVPLYTTACPPDAEAWAVTVTPEYWGQAEGPDWGLGVFLLFSSQSRTSGEGEKKDSSRVVMILTA